MSRLKNLKLFLMSLDFLLYCSSMLPSPGSPISVFEIKIIITARNFDYTYSSKLALLTIIRCLFEAEIDDLSLYGQLIPRLNRKLNLSHFTMTPFDCMSIGYFMASLLRAGGEVSVHLSCCSIDNYLLDLLVGEFSRHTEVCPAGVMQARVTKLDISGNNKITDISQVLQANITNKVKAKCCGISNLEMESLARTLAVNCSLEELDISDNNIGDNGIGHIATALLTNTTLKTLTIIKCVPCVGSSDSNHMNGRADIFTSLQKNTSLKTLNFSCCGISDLVAESLARALEANGSLKKLNIIDDNISDNGLVHIVKSLQKNNTLKVLLVGTKRYKDTKPVAGFTDTGMLSLARGIATNTSIEHLSIRWFSTDPENTLKMMAESVKNSSLKTLALYIGMCILQLDEAPAVGVQVQKVAVSPEKVIKWYHGIEVGGKELILSLEDSHLKSFELRVPPPSLYGYQCSFEFQTAVDSINSARHQKGLPNITFSF